jgi:hypothetical protein
MQSWTSSAGTVYYWEKIRSPASPVEAIGPNASQAVKTYITRWDNRQIHGAEVILGYPEVINDGINRPYIKRNLPMPHPDWTRQTDGSHFLYATRINRITGVTAPKHTDGSEWMSVNEPTTTRYGYAEMEIQFETLPYEVLADDKILQISNTPDEAGLQRYVEIFVAPAADYLSLPEGAFQWAGTTIPVPGRPGKIVPKTLITIVHHQVPKAAVGSNLINPSINDNYIDLMIGKVNKDPFPPGAAYPYHVGTLLYLAPVIEPKRSAFGDRIYTIKHRMLHLAVDDASFVTRGHNWLYRYIKSGASGYYECTSDGAANPTQVDNKNIYDWETLANVFRVPAS